MNRTPRVALMRNRIYPGGVFHVMLQMIRSLNQKGVVPDLVTLKSKVSPELAAQKYNMEVQFRVREILADLRIPYEWHILLFNKISRHELRKYDIVINHNNTSFLYERPGRQKLISYVHFPRKARGLSRAQSIHRPEGPRKKWYHIRHDPFMLASHAYRFDNHVDKEEIVLANSTFTRQTLLNHYAMEAADVDVLYPPVEIPDGLPSSPKDEMMVVSLGRFAPEKRQMEQLEIARQLPNLQFRIMGFLSDQNYFEKCRAYKERHGLDHVELLPDLPFDQLNTLLDRAGLFLHSIRNEPFGITTVEAISHGCLPVVPDSGGQVEIVPDQDLRYSDTAEAAAIIKRVIDVPPGAKKERRDRLFKRVQEFDTDNFRQQFDELLNKVTGAS
ncbi:glycosyltransferase family 4 protein [Halalkalibaculum sp. DA384]|uniref:glycosyltransferase family 4 protein n=1 Tax=Halalkalibaculum sp. DA384 TaxID=3373606 RepID=UPI003755416A